MNIPDTPPIIYAAFSSMIDNGAVSRLVQAFSNASAGNARELHLLFQSTGGMVGDGVALHNIFQALPFELHLYNSGTVASIATIAFLGAKHRYASAAATFMVHKSRFTPNVADAVSLRQSAASAEIEDKRTRDILEAGLRMESGELEFFLSTEQPIPAMKALEIGLVHTIRESAVPAGERMYSI